jgi:hypothetical protein
LVVVTRATGYSTRQQVVEDAGDREQQQQEDQIPADIEAQSEQPQDE